MNGLIDAYEHYFSNLISFQFNLCKKKQHTCLVCTSDLTDNCIYGVYSRNATEKFIINYLEHLKVFGYCVKVTDIFINSVRQNGILSVNVKGYWKIKKHDKYEVVIIEHCTSNKDLKDVRANFFENLLLKKKEEEEEIGELKIDCQEE